LPRDFCRLLGLGCPKQAFAKIVARLHERYHQSLNNLTPADVFYGRDTEILNQREIIKQNKLAMRKQLHYDKQHNTTQ
jgi:hypothetical protein